MKQAIFW